jgi:hypothetical protein
LLEVPLQQGRNDLTVLCDNLGYVKGAWQVSTRGMEGGMRPHEEDAKGLLADVTLDGALLDNWQFQARTAYERGEEITWREDERSAPLQLFRATFRVLDSELALPDREWWIDISTLGKGVIWVNGRNIGRYWNKNGYTRYFVPKCWLREENEVVFFEEEAHALSDARGVQLVWDKYAVATSTAA